MREPLQRILAAWGTIRGRLLKGHIYHRPAFLNASDEEAGQFGAFVHELVSKGSDIAAGYGCDMLHAMPQMWFLNAFPPPAEGSRITSVLRLEHLVADWDAMQASDVTAVGNAASGDGRRQACRAPLHAVCRQDPARRDRR